MSDQEQESTDVSPQPDVAAAAPAEPSEPPPTVEFAPASAGTTLTFTEQGVFLDGADTPAIREKGTAELLDQLGTALG